MRSDGIAARVIDAYSIKPIDAATLHAAARECGAIVTVEDHWAEGGLGDAVLEALAEARRAPAGAQARGARDADVRHARRAAALGRHRRRRDRRRRARDGAGEGRLSLLARIAGAAVAATLLAAAPAAADPEAQLTKWAKARERWAQQGALDYTFRVRLTCFCPRRNAVRIVVRDGKPRGTPRRLRAFDTIPELFALIKEEIDRGTPDLDARYAKVTGAPRSFDADPAPNAIDDEYAVTARKLRITRRAP